MIRFKQLIVQIEEWVGPNLDVLGLYNLEKLQQISKTLLNKKLQKYIPQSQNLELELFKEDTGILVLVFNNIVFKIYTSDKYKSLRSIFDLKSDNIENIIERIKLKNRDNKTLYVTIVEKIIPIIICRDNKLELNTELCRDKIYEDNKMGKIDDSIFSVLQKIHEIQFSHGDTRLDNIGIKKIDDMEYEYILFDFGASLFNNDNNSEKYKNDYDTYNRSKSLYLQLE